MNLFLICILFGLHVLVKDVELLSLTVPKAQEVATLGANQFTLSCTYNTEPGENFLLIELLRKRSGEAESSIVSFTKDANATYGDASLMTRFSSDWPTAGRTANLVFSSIICTDRAEYIWKATYVTTQVKYANLTVNVLVKAITTFNQTAGHITYSPSTNLAEGDEVVFICSGDVGNEPVGRLGWYYYLKSDPLVPVNASSRAQATTPVYQPSTCSFTRSSTLKLVMTKEFNQFLVRCTIQQSKYDQVGEGHRQTSNINVSYAPRIDQLNSVPVKTEGDSVILNCNADANPPPTYYWMLPNYKTSPGSQLQLVYLTVNDIGLYTCVAYNTYKNENHTTNASVRIDVRVKTPPPTKNSEMTTVGTGNQSESTEQSNNKRQDAKASQSSVTTIVGPIMGSLGAVVLTAVVLFIIYHRRKKLKAQKRGGNSAGVGTPESRRDFNIPENEGTDHTYNTLEGRETEHSYTVIENRGSDRVYMNSHESSETGRSYNTLGSSGTERTYNTLGSSGTERTYNTLGSSGTEHPYNTLESSGTEHPYNTLEGYAMNHIYNTLESKGTEHTYSVLKS